MNSHIRNSLKALALGILTLSVAAPAHAGKFSVTPVRIYMSQRDKAVAVTITNESDDDMVMQADIYVWKQKPGGQDELTPSEDLFLSPPIVKLAGKSRQVVRLARISPAKSDQQLTYRMIVREIPEARAAKDKVQLQIALAFSMPVFITPPGAKNKLDCTVERTAANAINAACENTGNAYAQVIDLALLNQAGEKLATRDTGGYILPGIKRTFDVKRTEGRIPAGKATLVVTLDNGAKQSYDVVLKE